MREITRDIVGGFILSSDEKILLGHNMKGGVYDDKWVVPGGGIDKGETQQEALVREMKEEIGLDITSAKVTPFETLFSATTEKTLRETGERVVVHMTFHDCVVRLTQPASEIAVSCEDDFASGQFFTPDELSELDIAGPTQKRLVELNLLKENNE